MRSWFPFTDYDFYGYLASGFAFLFALDFAITGGAVMLRDQWPFVQIVFVVALAYFVGQIIAAPSSTLLEHWIARSVLHPPIAILTGAVTPRHRERLVAAILIGRYYAPLDEALRQKILARAADVTGTPADRLVHEPEAIFQPAFSLAMARPDARARIDDFRNQYGLNRNMAFVGVAAGIMLSCRAIVTSDSEALLWACLSFAFGIGLFARFLKFYAAFAAEVLRAFAYSPGSG